MTITPHRFSAGMAALAGNFGREIDTPTQALYYAVLSPRLTDEEWHAALERVVSEDTFWPSAATILQKVKPSHEVSGESAFDHVNRVTRHYGGYRFLPHAVYLSEFDEPTRAAISAVNGLAAIANTTDERWPALKKRFAAAYAAALKPRPVELAPTGTDGRVVRLVKDTGRAMGLPKGDRD